MTQFRIYSNDILVALARRGPLNCRQLAGQISHTLDKTTALVAYMRINGKLQTTDEQVDGRAAYVLTAKGREAAAKLMDADPSDAQVVESRPAAAAAESPKPEPALDKAPPAVEPKRATESSATVKPSAAIKPSSVKVIKTTPTPVRLRIGKLNTGELMIWPVDGVPTLLEPIDVAVLRDFLVACA